MRDVFEPNSIETARLSESDRISQAYYDRQDTDNFYQKVSGGEHVHVGLFEHEAEDLETAKRRSVEYMAALTRFDRNRNVLDLGSGYGGAARYLSKTYGCSVACLNVSLKQNQVNRKRNQIEGLAHLITVTDGTFDNLPFKDEAFDLAWSQDAIFHSENPHKVFREVHRVLQNGGEFLFSAIVLNEQIAEDDRERLTRFYSLNLQTLQIYRDLADRTGLTELQYVDLSSNIAMNYSRLLSKMEELQSQDSQLWSQEFFINMKKRLLNWVEAGKNNAIHWGMLHLKKC